MARPSPQDGTTLTTIHRRMARVPSLKIVATSRTSGPASERRLGLSPVIAGTSADCDLVLDDPAVSRRHCTFTITPDGVLVKDLGSKNGTSIGGIEIREGFLTTTSFVRVGPFSIRLQVEGEPEDVPLWPGARYGAALGGSIVMRALFDRLHHAAQSDATVLLYGESGTGKEVSVRGGDDASVER